MSAHTHHNNDACEACASALTYTCDACGKASLKGRWGPGHVTCPECGAVQRSPAELAEAATCETWCGTNGEVRKPDDDPCFHATGAAGIYVGPRCYCTPACRDAGRPLHPVNP